MQTYLDDMCLFIYLAATWEPWLNSVNPYVCMYVCMDTIKVHVYAHE